MPIDEYLPRSPAPHTGLFEELNIFGAPTGVAVFMTQGKALPDTPRGFMWRSLAALSAAELRQRAEQYRAMAATARTAQAVDGLLKLAERFDTLAEERGRGDT